MNRRDIYTCLTSITYKRGWVLNFGQDGDDWWLMWTMTAPDYTQKDQPAVVWPCRVWRLGTGAGLTEDSLVKTALAAALQAEEHECREAFTYKGVRLFDPHLSVQKLMEVACHST